MNFAKFVEVLGKSAFCLICVVNFPLGFGLLCFQLGRYYEKNGKRFFKPKKDNKAIVIDSEEIDNGIVKF